jgi:hypothetical protein
MLSKRQKTNNRLDDVTRTFVLWASVLLTGLWPEVELPVRFCWDAIL